ncbi:unnamed protein product [Cylicocyclus nassatus]|uniref:Aldehyde oxidase/xanthine dehydrogenase second molybdopterin binding domain-containing protein n=1 Tax=Cylicocyclus nassatus TaxID=53992 RepID=A0AA36HDI9_CYLNA|nr:unnamed protein product [Cylicocyclus nassatus]
MVTSSGQSVTILAVTTLKLLCINAFRSSALLAYLPNKRSSLCDVREDCRTGEQKLLSVDMVLDVGRSLNPAIDIGQIEGSFMQGYGLMTNGEFTYDDNGKPIQDSMYKYKIPTAATVPRRFRVKLLKYSDTFAEQVYSSKGIGEPPLMLSVAAVASLRFAINARRRDLGFSDFIELSAPLTRAKIISFCNP